MISSSNNGVQATTPTQNLIEQKPDLKVLDVLHHDVESLPIEHLQLPAYDIQILKSKGILDIKKLCNAYVSGDLSVSVSDRLNLLLQASSQSGTDWYTFWGLIDFEFMHPYMTCREFEKVQDILKEVPISQSWYGSQVDIFYKNEMETVHDIIEALRNGLNFKGFGPKKRDRVVLLMLELAKNIRENGSIGDLGQVEATEKFDIPSIPESCGDYDISILRLGPKETALREQGVEKLKDLQDVSPEDLLSIKRFGKSSFVKLCVALDRLNQSCSESGGMDWSIFYSDDTVFFPKEPIQTKEEFIKYFGDLHQELISCVKKRKKNGYIYKTIFKDRIYPLNGDKKTLDRISRMTVPRITRERVRQMEEYLLNDFHRTFLGEHQAFEGLHVDESFKEFFRDFYSFILKRKTHKNYVDLLNVGISDENMNAMENFILSVGKKDINSKQHRMKSENIPTIIIGDGNDVVDFLDLNSLNIGRHYRSAEKIGLKTISDLRKMVNEGLYKSLNHNMRMSLFLECEKINAIANLEGVCWEQYADLTGLPFISLQDGNECRATKIVNTCVKLLSNAPSAELAQHIFSVRTSIQNFDRPTTAEVAETFNTYSSSIKRIETETLLYLNRNILTRNHAQLGAVLSDAYFDLWLGARKAFIASGCKANGISGFLSHQGFSQSEIISSLPSFVAVLSGYPLYSKDTECLKVHPKSFF